MKMGFGWWWTLGVHLDIHAVSLTLSVLGGELLAIATSTSSVLLGVVVNLSLRFLFSGSLRGSATTASALGAGLASTTAARAASLACTSTSTASTASAGTGTSAASA